MNEHQQDPLNEFMETESDIKELLSKLREHADNHFGPDSEVINWSDVGNLKAIKNMMQQILNFVEEKE
jgi:hypothetical protein